jgi:acetyl esterase/lipase
MAAVLAAPVSAETIPLPEGAKRVPDHNGYDYVPFDIEGARLVPRVRHLQPGRDWERMDVYIPESARSGDKLPCIVDVYGGGYGQKGVGTMKGVVKPLIDRGFVVACPDYALQVHAPEALASWDVANAVRHLRANADKYNIDPERIGLVGWSAGGWIAQFIGYAGPADIRPVELPGKSGGSGATPTIEPRPLHPDHPLTLQSVVSDWGAGKLTDGKGEKAQPHISLSPDDPPLLTCFSGKPREMPKSSVGFLQALSIPAEPVFLGDAKSTHVPRLDTPGWDADGNATTWEGAIYDFFDRTVKNPKRSSPPQIVCSAGDNAKMGDTVRLLSVHAIYGDGSVHYTLDNSEPTKDSPQYERPIELKPAQKIKAIAIKPGLPASAVATYTAPLLPRPVIISRQTDFNAKVGQKFRVEFEASMPVGAAADLRPTWVISGRVGLKYRPYNPPRTVAWMQIDRDTGVLTGVPRAPGVYPVIVSAFVTTDTRGRLDRDQTVADAQLIVITVTK